ncbi:O-antigen ligase family protein [Thiomicrorhabdus indica]|uniref:O-antigen ligase family protein n=1 Tax=Thiomicrorhabdus indica TaxID=2267253 RepID=UPI002AA715E7|nr:O-antigen ligase family protein [Thiomicrorhabdus indica]
MQHFQSQNQLNYRARKASEFLIIPAFFFLPIQAAPVNSLLVLAIFFWLFTGNLKQQLVEAWQHPLTKAFLFFAFSAWISLLWTENIDLGLWFAKKYITYLVFPIVLLLIRPDFLRYYLGAFFAGIALSELLSYGLWLDIIELERANPDHTAFIGHILYSPIVAFATYIMLSRLVLFWKEQPIWQKITLMFFSSTIIVNLFFTHGRTGMVALIFLLFTLLLLKFPNHKVKAILGSFFISATLLTTTYFSLNDFKQRVDVAYHDIEQLINHQNAVTSVGNRLVNWVYSAQMIQQNPILGVGLGDYGEEFSLIAKQQNFQTVESSINPHNQYLFSWTTSGIIGIISLFTLFWVMIQLTYKTQTNKEIHVIRWGLIVLFAVICLAESYLWRSNTGLLLLLFSALLFPIPRPPDT